MRYKGKSGKEDVNRTIVGMPAFDERALAEAKRTRPKSPLEHLLEKVKIEAFGQRMFEDFSDVLPSSDDPESDLSDFDLLKGLPRKCVENTYSLEQESSPDRQAYTVKVRDLELPYGQGHIMLFREERKGERLVETLAFVRQGVFMDDMRTLKGKRKDHDEIDDALAAYVKPKVTLHAVLDSIDGQKGHSWLPEVYDDEADRSPHIRTTSLCSYFTVSWKKDEDPSVEDQDYVAAGARKLMEPSNFLVLDDDTAKELHDGELSAYVPPVKPGSKSSQPPGESSPLPSSVKGKATDDRTTITDDTTLEELDKGWLMFVNDDSIDGDSTIEVFSPPVMEDTDEECWEGKGAQLWCAYEALDDLMVQEEVKYLLDDALTHISRSSLTSVIGGLLILYDTGRSLFALHLDKEGIQACISSTEKLTPHEARGHVYADNLFYMKLDERTDFGYPLESFYNLCDGHMAISAPEDSILKGALDVLMAGKDKTCTEEDVRTHSAVRMHDGKHVFIVGQWSEKALDEYFKP